MKNEPEISEERIQHYSDSYGMTKESAKEYLEREGDYQKKFSERGYETLAKLRSEIEYRKRMKRAEKILNKNK